MKMVENSCVLLAWRCMAGGMVGRASWEMMFRLGRSRPVSRMIIL